MCLLLEVLKLTPIDVIIPYAPYSILLASLDGQTFAQKKNGKV